MNTDSAPATIVLVHGGFVDGSGWRPVYDLLTRDGHHVAVVQNPTLSLPGDAAAARLIIDAQDGPVVLVGHSYGGAVISEAGTHPNVAALVYISAFAPDKDESVNTLISGFPADGPQPPILPPRDGFLFLDRDKFQPAPSPGRERQTLTIQEPERGSSHQPPHHLRSQSLGSQAGSHRRPTWDHIERAH
jgi:pimeloyl-ACP methyl ester carboxylesterase